MKNHLRPPTPRNTCTCNTFSKNDIRLSDSRHPADILEPETRDDNVLQAAEAFNAVSHWVLGIHDPSVIGRRALCILLCARRESLPRSGLFRAIETETAEQLVKTALVEILDIIVDPRDLKCTGRKVVAAFSWIRTEIMGTKTLSDLGQMLGCRKQAVSQNQARFERALKRKFPARRRR
ncbi:MAG: hypothetical protein KBG39_03930 [Opitutaceae bacterium]|jgi:hypothetical protein|nr:hypothetical protein [Opitutaceae bacterium]MBP8962073.1 hypothetical protein [Opitutaceae bacterium]